MRTTLLALACVGILAAAPARGQSDDKELKVGDYAPAIEGAAWIGVRDQNAPSMSELRGMIVVLFFWVSFHEGGEAFMPLINQVQHHPAFGKRAGVAMIGVTDAERKAVEKEVLDNKITFPVACESKAHQEYGITTFPSIVIVDPEGKIAFKGVPSGDQIVQQLIDVIEKTPPYRSHPDEAARAVAEIQKAREFMAAGDFHRAFKTALVAWQRPVLGDPLKAEAFNLLELLEQMGRDQLADADRLLDAGDYREADRVLRTVRRLYRGLNPGDEARDRIDRLKDDSDDYKRAVSAHGDEEAAADLLYAAMDDIRGHALGRGHGKLSKILSDYPKTESASYAGQIIERMKANRNVWDIVKDYSAGPQCRQMLAQARNYKQSGRYAEARRLFERVLSEHPDTQWADEAKRELIGLPG